MKRNLLFILFAFATLALLACSHSQNGPDPNNNNNHGNNPPHIYSFSMSKNVVFLNDTIQFSVESTDPDNDVISYKWSFSRGRILSGEKAPIVSWIAPGDTSKVIAIVNVSDGDTVSMRQEEFNVYIQANIVATPSRLDFGSKRSLLFLELVNGGYGTLDWVIPIPDFWLSIPLRKGNLASGEKIKLECLVDRADVVTGDYNEDVKVVTSKDTVHILVTMEKATSGEPKISVQPSTVDFGVLKTVETISISNLGYGYLDWIVVDKPSWIGRINPLDARIAPEEVSNVQIVFDREILPDGNYSGGIWFDSNGGSRYVAVRAFKGSFYYTPERLEFVEGDGVKELILTNETGVDENYTLSSSVPWLYLQPTEGFLRNGDADTIAVWIDESQLAWGIYTADLVVRTSNGRLTIPVKVRMGPETPVGIKPGTWQCEGTGPDNKLLLLQFVVTDAVPQTIKNIELGASLACPDHEAGSPDKKTWGRTFNIEVPIDDGFAFNIDLSKASGLPAGVGGSIIGRFYKADSASGTWSYTETFERLGACTSAGNWVSTQAP